MRVFHLKQLSWLLLLIVFAACSQEPDKFNYGKDTCAECKMTIMDPKFGAQIVTKKGRKYKFDDVHCLAKFLERRGVDLGNISQTVFVNYNNKEEFIKVEEAEFVVSSTFKSPMGGNAAAFKNKQEAAKVSAGIDGSKTTNWATLYNILIK